MEGIAGTYGVVRVFQHTGGFFPFLFQKDDVARRERGAARHFVVTAQTALGFAGPFANGGVGVAGKGYDIETLVATVNTALGGGGGDEGGGGGRRLVRHEGGGGMARKMVVAMEAVALYEADEQMGVSGVGGVACRFESVGPAFVVVALEGEEGGIAAAPGEEEGMVFIGGKNVWIDSEFLSNGVVVFQHDGAGPRGACLDAEMVVGLGGKEALPGAALEEALGEGDAGGDAVFVHLLHGEGLVALDVGRVGVGLRAKDGEDGEEEAEGEQAEGDGGVCHGFAEGLLVERGGRWGFAAVRLPSSPLFSHRREGGRKGGGGVLGVEHTVAQNLGKLFFDFTHFLVALHERATLGGVGLVFGLGELEEDGFHFALDEGVFEIVDQTRNEFAEAVFVFDESLALALAEDVFVGAQPRCEAADFGVGMGKEMAEGGFARRQGEGGCFLEHLAEEGGAKRDGVGSEAVADVAGYAGGRFAGEGVASGCEGALAVAKDGGDEHFFFFDDWGGAGDYGFGGGGVFSPCGCGGGRGVGTGRRSVGTGAGGCCCATPDFGDFGNDELLWGGEQASAFTDVHLTDDAVGDDGDAVDNVLHEGGPLDGVVGGVVEQQAGFEADEIDLAGFDVVLKVGGRVLTGEAVGVVAIGQEEDFDVQSFCKQHVDATQAGMDAGGVAIVEHGDIVGEAVDQAYLPLREGGAAGGDNVFYAALVHGDDVHIALNEVAAVLLDDGVLGEVEAIELAAFAIDFRLGGIDVFRHFLVGREGAATEGDGHARNGLHGEDDAGVVAVEQAPLVGAVAESGFLQHLFAEALGEGGLGEGVAHGKGIAEMEFANDVVAQSALPEIGHADGNAVDMVVERFFEIFVGPLV